MRNIILTFRKLKKDRTSTLLGLAGLVTGLVCVIYIFFWVNDEISFDRFHKNIDRIFVVHAYLEGGTKTVTFQGCPPAVAPALKAEYPEVENTCRYVPAFVRFLVSAEGKKEMFGVAFADNSFFDIFTLPFVYGNQGDPNVPNQIVMTKKTAAILFGNTNPVGKVVRFNNTKDLTVAGVIDDIPHNSTIQFDAILPIENIGMFYGRNDFLTTWYNNSFTTYGLLSSPAGFDKIASTITRRIQKEIPESTNYLRAFRFKDGYLYEQKHIRNVQIFSLIALLVLLAATFNFINLITARSAKQAKETGLRKSIGATRGNVIRLIYFDVAILCLFAYIMAFAVAAWGLPLFDHAIGKNIALSGLFAVKPMLSLLAAYLITTFLAGSYPAFFLSSFRITDTLSSNFYSVKSRGIFRSSLLVTIFVVSIILLTSTFIINKQTLFLQKMDVGFDKEQLLYVNLQGKLKDKATALKEEIARTPGVSSSTIADFLPVVIGNNGEGWDWEGKDPDFKLLVTSWRTDEDLAKTLKAKMIEGSFFSSDRQGIVINKAFADALGWKSFVGKTLKGYGEDYRITGVINNIEYNSLAETCRPMMIQPVDAWSSNYLIVKVNTADIGSTIKSVRQACEKLEPDFPVTYGFIDEAYSKLYESESKLKNLVGVFSVLSIVVLCLGLLGVIMFMAEQRTKEIGVRKCLGEQGSSIIIRFLKPVLVSGLIAGGIAVPVTWYIMNRWLENYANRISLNVWIFAAAVTLVLIIALLTVSWQSWRAATKNPVEALRYE